MRVRRRDASPDAVALVLAVAPACGVQAQAAGPGAVRFLTPVAGVASVRRLERRLLRHSPDQWPALAREHVSRLVAGASPGRPAHARSWDEVRPKLRARLRPVAVARSDRLPTYVLRHVGVGLGEVLAVVDDDAVTTVSRLAVPRWGVDLDLAVRTGRDNVRRAGVLQRRRDGPWLVLSGDEFTSTHVWWVRQEVLDAGASPLVALPTPTIVLVAAEPGGPRGDSVLTQMAEQARRWHDEAPDRLSPYVYRAVAGELRLAVGFGADGRLHLSDR